MRSDLLLWLAESHRNFHLAGPGLSDSLSEELQDQAPWAYGAAYEDFTLRYEPRSLARSPDGKKIVVGTKAGVLHLANWDGSRWQYGVEWQLGGEPRWQGETITRSIRAVRFLDDQTLIAGWGEGVFGIFDADELACRDLVRATPPQREGGHDPREQEWLGRFARFISLVPPAAASSSRSAVMLGVTIGSKVHVLYQNEETYSAGTFMPEDILPEWDPGARVVDGVWSHNLLWVLDSSGHIYRYAPVLADGTRLPISLIHPSDVEARREGENASAKGIFLLEHPREIGEFRAIAACVMGLAVLTSDDITFLRFKMPQGGNDLPAIDPASARWVAVPSAIDCSVCLPFCNYYEGPLASQTITGDNPVWTIVGTSRSGLRWISWHDPKKGSSNRLPALSLHRAGSGDSSVLQARFGFHGRQGPTYIACATRDHRLRIITLLDRKKTEALLEKEIPEALKKDKSLSKQSGVAWWLLLQFIQAEFLQVESTEGDDELRGLLRFSESEDLYRLIRWVLNRWRESPLASEMKRKLLRDWICRILGRSYQIHQTLAQELAKLTYDRIAQMRGSSGARGRQVEEDLGLFAEFLRKWVVYGHTYEEKANNLLQLYHWNKRSGHALDALTYLTKLLRRRVDSLWEARPTPGLPSSAIWDLAATRSGEFSIHSCTDGRIVAVGRQGEQLLWEANGPVAESLARHFLDIYQGQLRHTLAEDFFRQYRHGPYARAVLLSPLLDNESDSPYLMVFCLRGWRREDQLEVDDRNARLYCLLVQPGAGRMDIHSVDSQPLPDDLYGMLELEGLSQRGKIHIFVAGTKGAWRSGGRWIVQPFVEFSAVIEDGVVRLEIDQKVRIWSDRGGERSVFKTRLDYIGKEEVLPESAHNPCWSFSTYVAPAEKLWLWAGFHDGHIRCFLRAVDVNGELGWIEGGGLVRASDGEDLRFTHEELGLTTSAPVWRLHILNEQQLLAYGSADGVIGAVSLAHPKDSYGDQRPHLAHYRESSPICGLRSYIDPEGGVRLLAVTQGGVVIIVDLGGRCKEEDGPHFSFAGGSLDRFALGHEARAVAIIDYCDEPHNGLLGGCLPGILVGANEGGVFKHVLALPKSTERRRNAFHVWCRELLEYRDVESVDGTRQPPPLSLFIGEDVYGWLRVLDIRGVHLLRFSMAWELREKWPTEDLAKLAKENDQDIYLNRLNDLADDVYGRRPLTPEPAKVIWEEAARVSNTIAGIALDQEEGEEREALLLAFLKLNKTVDDLCNRWIGSEQAVESRVLMHTFNCLFDWVGVVLIGLAQATPNVLSVRRFLLHKVIQRRLGFNDPLVYLETLRTLNVALVRAVRNSRTEVGGLRWSLNLRPHPEVNGRAGLYDLLAMVGDLGEQHSRSLTPADPLWTELSRFFAASLLLLPSSSFVISQVIAESRLTERDTQFARAVRRQADVIISQLAISHTEEFAVALRQFSDSFDENIDEEICKPPGMESEATKRSEAWRRLLSEAEDAERQLPEGGYSTFSNETFLLDHAAAIRTTAYLIWLTNEEPLPRREQEWLGATSRYFEHSRLYLRRMLKTWRKVRGNVMGEYDEAEQENPGVTPASISRAIDLCNQEAQYLANTADLFEPQRTQYIRVVDHWRQQVWKRAEDAIDLLDILDKFNRHTYRASSDRLMSGITELAFQATPLWLDLLGAKPLRSELERRLESQPLVRAIFDSGNRLVASTHLAGTLFTVARDYYLKSSAPAPRQTTLKDIYYGLEKFATFEGMRLMSTRIINEEVYAPGTIAVWDTLLQEVVTNTRKYGSQSDRKLFVRLDEKEGEVRLSFAGGRPFIESLHSDHRGQLAADLPASQRLEYLQRLVKRAKVPGQRLAPQEATEEISSGMGIPLILRICRYIGMHADVVLRDLEAGPGLRSEELTEEIKLRWPLCLEISWEVTW